MEKQKAKISLDDILDELVYSSEPMTAASVERIVKRYPEFKREIAEFVAAWAVTESVDESDISDIEVSQEEILRLQSLTLNYLSQHRPVRTNPSEDEVHLVRAALDTYRGETLITRLTNDLGFGNWTELTAFILNGVINPAPKYVMRKLAEMLTVPVEAVETALMVNERRRLVHLSSKTKPRAESTSFSWEQAIQTLPANEAEKNRLLALSDRN